MKCLIEILFFLPGLFLTMIKLPTVAFSVKHLGSSLETCCTCWTAEMKSGGRPVRSARRMRLKRLASSPASTGQTLYM